MIVSQTYFYKQVILNYFNLKPDENCYCYYYNNYFMNDIKAKYLKLFFKQKCKLYFETAFFTS